MLDLTETIEAIKTCRLETEKFANVLRSYPTINRSDIESLAEFSPKVRIALTGLDEFFVNSRPVKTVLLRKEGIKVTNTGRFFYLSGEEIHPVWYDGELRLKMKDGVIKRCSTLVAIGFEIKSKNRDTMMNIAYHDGDRRNITPENLYWTETYNQDYKRLLVEDICRRIVQYKGDVDTILDQYVGSVPTVGRSYVQSIINKEIFKDVSDDFFDVDSDGNIVSLMLDTATNDGADCYALLVGTKDTGLAEQLLTEKVKLHQKLSVAEMEIICISCLNGDNLDYDWTMVIQTIFAKYGLGLTEDQIKKVIYNRNSASLKTVKEIYGGVNNG